MELKKRLYGQRFYVSPSKRMITLWIDHNLITKSHFNCIQEFIDQIIVPPDIGRIPHKIESGFSSFKADQFKTWVNVYSIPALFNVLTTEHLECWRHFVLACRIICKQSLSTSDIDLADTHLNRFCIKVEQLFGRVLDHCYCVSRLEKEWE